MFNLFAFYILGIFVFGEGGVKSNTEKIETITELEMEKLEEQVELTELMSRLLYLQELDQPDLNILAQNGKKYEDAVIFKFDTETKQQEPALILNEGMNKMNDFRIYIIIGLVVLMLIAGNSLLIIKIARTT